MSNNGKTLEKNVVLNVSPTEAYTLISQPQHIARWFSDEAELRDDHLHVSWNQQDGGKVGFAVVITETVPGQRFAYQSTDEHKITTVFDLSPQADGCLVRVTETMPSTAPQSLYDEHAQGWDWFLYRLKELH